VVGILPVLHKETHIRFLAHHANPLNFVSFAFAGVGLARLSAAGAARTRTWVGIACVALAGGTAILDWTVYVDPCFFEVNEYAMPAYTRPSLVFLAVAVLVGALRIRMPPSAAVRFMAAYSLGVYCLHPFFVDGRDKIIQVMHLSGLAAVLVPWVLVLVLSYVGSVVMPLFLREEMIR
jgi:hypothetical protein